MPGNIFFYHCVCFGIIWSAARPFWSLAYKVPLEFGLQTSWRSISHSPCDEHAELCTNCITGCLKLACHLVCCCRISHCPNPKNLLLSARQDPLLQRLFSLAHFFLSLVLATQQSGAVKTPGIETELSTGKAVRLPVNFDKPVCFANHIIFSQN